MTATAIRELAERLRKSNPEDSHEQRELFERIRELRSAFDGPMDPESQRRLEASSMLVAFLARMGSLAGEDVRAIAVRLLISAAEAEDSARSATSAPSAPVRGIRRLGQSSTPPPVPPANAPQPAKPDEGQSATDLMGDMMLGQVLLQRGHILEEHIHQAMKVQRTTSMRIGDILVKIGACSREQLGDALSHQASLRRVRESLHESTPHAPVERAEPHGKGLKLVGEALLGEILVERNLITRRQLERALEAQKLTGVRIGEALVQMGATTMEQIEQALHAQGRERRFAQKGTSHPHP